MAYAFAGFQGEEAHFGGSRVKNYAKKSWEIQQKNSVSPDIGPPGFKVSPEIQIRENRGPAIGLAFHCKLRK